MDPVTLALAKSWADGEFGGLRPIIPHVAELLDSRIVSHNLDVVDSPNGYYVRWENGFYICIVEFRAGPPVSSSSDLHRYNATPPIELSVGDPHYIVGSENQVADWARNFNISFGLSGTGELRLYTDKSPLVYPVVAIVVGVSR